MENKKKKIAKKRKSTKGRTDFSKKDVDYGDLKKIMQFKPSLLQVAGWFEVSTETIKRRIKDFENDRNMNFVQFRDKYMARTQIGLQQTAIKKALTGDNCMLIFCLKNLCGWADNPQVTISFEDEVDYPEVA